VALTSDGHKLAPREGINFDTLKSPQESMWTTTRYGQSKLANILFAAELARRYPQIKAMSVHPGFVQSNLMNPLVASSAIMRPLAPIGKWLMAVPVEDGAKNQLWAAVSPDAKTGTYYIPIGRGGREEKIAKDEGLAKRLWEWTEKELDGQTA
jgi:retinol dehydrogenase 12